MENIILVVHLSIVIAMILAILVQRTNTDGLSGLGGGSSNGNALFSVRSKSNFLTKITSFLALGFLITSLTLAYLANHHKAKTSVVDAITAEKAKVTTEDFNAPAAKKEVPTAATPAKKTAPAVPLAK